MRLSYKVMLEKDYIGVSDNDAGLVILEQIYKDHGDRKIWVYDYNDIFGVGYSGARPIFKTTIKRLLGDYGIDLAPAPQIS